LVHYQFLVIIWLIRNKDKFDVIHSFDLDSGLPVFFVSKVIHKKYIYHIADYYVDSRDGIPYILKFVLKRLEYKVIANAETTIVCTDERIEQIKGSKPKKVVVIHNAPSIKVNNSGKKSSTDYISDKKITFAYVGGLTKKRFIKSIIDIFKHHHEFNLELAGMGELSNYAKQASEKYENINYYGMVNYEEALNLYSKCDIMFAIYDPAVPNHRYSAPNKVYEAMMLGKPIIVARNTSVDKIVEKEDIGFVIDYTKEDFEDILFTISDDKSILKKYGQNALEVYNKYSWEEMKRRLIDIYDDISN
jgi:glycosyltransferase involved in cell wall biosynthesis